MSLVAIEFVSVSSFEQSCKKALHKRTGLYRVYASAADKSHQSACRYDHVLSYLEQEVDKRWRTWPDSRGPAAIPDGVPC